MSYYQKAKTYITHTEAEKVLFFILLFVLCVTAIGYAYFVNKTVLNVVARKDTAAEIEQLRSRLSDLEFSYLQKKDTVNRELAREYGFVEITEATYVAKTQDENRLTLREAR